MQHPTKITLILCLIMTLFSCAQNTPTEEVVQDENAEANALFEKIFNDGVDRSPIWQSYLGIKKDYDKWDDLSESYAQENHLFVKQQLASLDVIDTDKLNEQTLISYRLLEQGLQDEIDAFKWRHHDYPVNQMFGYHSMVPSFLINIHGVTNVKDAEDYISRLRGVPKMFEQLIDGLEIRKEKGIIAPKFVFPKVIRDSKNVIDGLPFTDDSSANDSTLLADIKKKVNALDIDDAKKASLIQEAEDALKEDVGPAYESLIAYLQDLETYADTRDGAWKFPDGDAFYNHALERTTTTKLTADEIHEIGLKDVDKIHEDMRAIMKQVGFEGTLNEFFVFMREDEQFYYPQTEEGKQRYLKEAEDMINTMKGALDGLFLTKPKADLIVKAVEPFREQSAGKAFYQQPASDGSRPGIYYANLSNMADMPTYQMEALAYHEGLPGHHMQISIAQELENMPSFRKHARYIAYVEGWGLYSEYIPKELGFYQDPYSDFGRLAMELWRACRLVVDTGLHAKRWSREKAIEYLVDNTPNPRTDAVKAIERYIVMPSQATAYKIGMIKILELRDYAKEALGEDFDIREYHDVVLKNGAVPLDVLEQLVESWVAEKKS